MCHDTIVGNHWIKICILRFFSRDSSIDWYVPMMPAACWRRKAGIESILVLVDTKLQYLYRKLRSCRAIPNFIIANSYCIYHLLSPMMTCMLNILSVISTQLIDHDISTMFIVPFTKNDEKLFFFCLNTLFYNCKYFVIESRNTIRQ